MQIEKRLWRPLLPIMFIFLSLQTKGQALKDFSPLSNSGTSIDSLLHLLETKHQNEIAPYEREKESLRREVMVARWDEIQQVFRQKLVLFDHPFYARIASIVSALRSSQPAFPWEKVHILLVDLPSPNATSLGDGTIFLNVGLVSLLENEDQLAFVICHELAHYFLDHFGKKIEYRQALESSETYQAQSKELNKQKYGKREIALQMLKSLSFGVHKHSRESELEADSLGLNLLLSSHFNPVEALSCMDMLNKADEDPTYYPNLAEIFHCDAFPFQPQWLTIEKPKLGKGNAPPELNDSLRTHPDCQLRKEKMASILATKANVSPTTNSTSTFFEYYKQQCTGELGLAYWRNGNWGMGLFSSLEYWDSHRESQFAKAIVMLHLVSIAEAVEAHQLNKGAELPNLHLPKGYNLVLNFIRNIPNENWVQIIECFASSAPIPSHEYLIYAHWRLSKLSGHEQGMQEFKTMYLRLYPNGLFKTELN